jgi:hypothetical protein
VSPTLTAERPTRQQRLAARSDRFVHHEYEHSTLRAMRRKFRLRGVWSVRMHAASAQRQLERYGLDVTGDKQMVTDCRRRLRNARKAERR